jgi:hypothetical protein
MNIMAECGLARRAAGQRRPLLGQRRVRLALLPRLAGASRGLASKFGVPSV